MNRETDIRESTKEERKPSLLDFEGATYDGRRQSGAPGESPSGREVRRVSFADEVEEQEQQEGPDLVAM